MPHITRILVPTDFSSSSSLATDYAIDMARRYGAAIQLLHVMEEFAHMSVCLEGCVYLPEIGEKLKGEAEARLAALAQRCEAAGVAVRTRLLIGRPIEGILKTAKDATPDLIVMGTHGRGGLAHLLLGSVAERVVRTAPCPVLTVRDTATVAEAVAAHEEALPERPAPLQLHEVN